MKKYLFLIMLLGELITLHGQVVMNGGQVVEKNGAYIVLTDANPSGIIISNTTGGFVLDDAASRIRWKISNSNGNYTIPYYYAGTYLPLSYSTSLAVGAGYFDLGTYATPTWKNSDYLPPGVTDVNHNGADNSAHLADRFWSIDAVGYTTKPTLSNLSFTYRDLEWNAAGNAINESLLKAQRWNSVLMRWSDFAPAGTANTGTNTVTVASVSPANLYQWWTLVDAAYPLPLQLLSFRAKLKDKKVFLDWATNLEINTKEFVVERSVDRMRYYPIDTVAAAGTSNTTLSYASIDPFPLSGISYYRLRMIDVDGKFSYSPIAVIVNELAGIIVFPNPVKGRININTGDIKVQSYTLYDAMGRLVKSGPVSNVQFTVEVSELAQGAYLMQLQTATGTMSYPVIKD